MSNWERSDARRDSLKHGPVEITQRETSPADIESVRRNDAKIRAQMGNLSSTGSFLDYPLNKAKDTGETWKVHANWPDFKDAKGNVRNQANSVASTIRCGDGNLPGKFKNCGRDVFKAETRYVSPGLRSVWVTYMGT